MYLNSQDKKKSRTTWDRDVVSMEREQRSEICRNLLERKGSRSRSKEMKAMSDRDFGWRERVQREGMYHNSQGKTRSRSRSREKKEICDFDLDAIERAQIEGNILLRKHANASKITLDFTPGIRASAEGNSYGLEFKRASSKKASGTPIKALIDNEMSHEKEIRQSSPSLLARLMGLDTVPSVVSRQKKERGISSQKTSSVGLCKKHTAHEGHPLRLCNSEYDECKDIYEVMEMPMAQKQNDKLFQKATLSLKQSEVDFKPSNTNLAFSKKYMDTTHRSTDDEFEYHEEHNNALDALDPSKDIFVKFLQEPNSLFKKHLQDLKCSPPSPHASHITILKPSKFAKSGKELCYESERNVERRSSFLKGDLSFGRKPVSNLVGHSVEEDRCSFPHKLSEPLYAGKSKVHHKPTQIVVLKPSQDKGWNARTAVPIARSPDNYHYDLKRIPMSRRPEVYAGRRDRPKLPKNMEIMGHEEKGLREIARDITKQLRTAKNSSGKMVPTLKNYEYSGNESLRGMPGIENLDLKSLEWSCKQLNDDSDDLSTSSYYSTESSVTREARRRLSQRWKMIHHSKWDRPLGKGSSTLGELLVSDKDTPRNTLNSSTIRNVSDEKVARGEVLAKWDCPLGIGSKEGWKVERSSNLSRSESLLDASLLYGNRQMSKRNKVGDCDRSNLQSVSNKDPSHSLVRNVSRRRSPIQNLKHCDDNTQFYFGGEESDVSDWEIHISEELHSRINGRHLTEAVCGDPELLNVSVAGRGHEGGNLAPQCKVANFPLASDDQQGQQPTKMAMPVNDGEFSTNPNHVARKETLGDHPQVNPVSSHCEISESPSPVSSKEDQPSPVSVLELPPSEEDRSSSECFEKISADLKELRMQLRLLKLESADTDDEDLELIISSDEDVEGEHHSPRNSELIPAAFIDNEDRDFSYLLDVLIDSSVQPVGREVFEELEKKYNALYSWSRSDRMLLFDLITSTVADIITVKSKSPYPTIAHEALVDKVWFLVAKRREELSGKRESNLILEQKWLDLGDDVDITRKELEWMLFDDLIEELVDCC